MNQTSDRHDEFLGEAAVQPIDDETIDPEFVRKVKQSRQGKVMTAEEFTAWLDQF